MTVLAVIPARWQSTRFPGKPLASLRGRAMIAHVWERTMAANLVDAAVVATDDGRIADYCRGEGIEVEMTAADHATGTDRLAEIAGRRAADIYVNVQGDEPMIDPAGIDAVIACLNAARARGIDVATGYIEGASADDEANASVVHLTRGLDGCVMALSRLPIPAAFDESQVARNIHVGLYAFTGAALERFRGYQRGPVELAESIEIMRFLERGERISAVPVPPGSIGVDTPDDLARAEKLMAAEG